MEQTSEILFVAEDGKTVEVLLTELQDCEDCILTFRKKGGFSLLIPGRSNNLLLKGVVEVEVE